MSAHSGIEGKVVKDSNTVANIDTWNLTLNDGIQDITEFTGVWDDVLAGILSGSGNMSGNYDEGDTYQAALVTAFTDKTAVTLKLYISATHYWSMTALITNINVSNNVKGKVTIDMQFKSKGAVTYN